MKLENTNIGHQTNGNQSPASGDININENIKNYVLKHGVVLKDIPLIEGTFTNKDLKDKIAEVYLRYFPDDIKYFSDYPEDWKERCEKICFFITPIGKDGSKDRLKLDKLYTILSPVLDKYKIILIDSDKIVIAGNIVNQIIKNLLTSDLAIANLTGLNPNVLYELGIRHAVKKHVICIAEEGTNLPFNIKDYRTIFYNHDNVDTFNKKLSDTIENILKGSKVENPVTTAILSVENKK